jgi:hypothetical protein
MTGDNSAADRSEATTIPVSAKYIHCQLHNGSQEVVSSRSSNDFKTSPSVVNRRLSCLCFNARSIVHKHDELLCTVDAFHPDIIGITESWTNADILDSELGLHGFDLFRHDRPGQHKGGGVLLYVRSELQAVAVVPRADFPEHVWCKISAVGGRYLFIGVIYRTPSSDIFDIDVDGQLRHLMSEMGQHHVLIMGDFNYGDIHWTPQCSLASSAVCQLFVDCLEENFLVQMVSEPTRIVAESSILDLVITDDQNLVDGVSVLGHFGSSDHLMVII